MFKIPFLILPYKIVDRLSNIFLNFGRSVVAKQKNFSLYFLQADIPIKPEKYVAIGVASAIVNFLIFSIFTIILAILGKSQWLYVLIASVIVVFFMYMQQMSYPKLVVSKKVRNIEANLLPALRAMTVQLTAGVTFFNALKNIAKSNYSVISDEFQKAINAMESGTPAIEALERVSRDNPSLFFRRAIWQIITGMQVGADISGVLREIVKSLIQEQVTEIQTYGGKLSPLSMFYMVIAIIFPALGITFVLVLSTFVQALGDNYKTILFVIMGTVIFLQIIFLGMIKSGRPPLL
ncbi:MAG: type II secretion system F family protein [Candidatus Pacearchaeota archaeon]|nr:type II secretion system F family protein [Candidatus Pacearchaeota archaeon]